jgi:hypothetical protein
MSVTLISVRLKYSVAASILEKNSRNVRVMLPAVVHFLNRLASCAGTFRFAKQVQTTTDRAYGKDHKDYVAG